MLSKEVDAKPVSGKVFLLVGGKLVPLTEADQLRSGTVVDARNGSLQLTTASSEKHKHQTGTFGGAIFKITQVHSGLTTLSLVESALKGAPSFASSKTKGAHAAALSNKALQLLHSSAKGKFRTNGRYAAATVRGTKWTIADRCDGTLTHDRHRLGRGQRLRPPSDDRASPRAELSRQGAAAEEERRSSARLEPEPRTPSSSQPRWCASSWRTVRVTCARSSSGSCPKSRSSVSRKITIRSW